MRKREENRTGRIGVGAFVRGMLMLSGASLLLRFVSLRFQMYLTDTISGAGVGLVELILSVFSFAVTFSGAGVSLAASRLCAEELERGSGAGVRETMRRCLRYSLGMGTAAGGVLFLLADFVAVRFLSEPTAAGPLRVLACSLPCIAAGSAMGGYFSAVRRVGKCAAGDLLSLFFRIGVTVLLLRLGGTDPAERVLKVVLGMSIAECLSFLYQFLLYRRDLAAHVSKSGGVRLDTSKRLLGITLPIALSSYIRSGLLTLEHLLIPWGLRRRGASVEESLAAYGILTSMALPILFFPASFLYAANRLLIPEIARAAGSEEAAGKDRVCRLSRGLLYATLLFGIGTAATLLCFSRPLGALLHDDARVGHYLALLAPLLPIMYLDSAADSLLKGLGEQVYCMGVNILDAALSALLVFFLVPRYGVEGYIFVLICSELVNASFSLNRLASRVRLRVRLGRWVLIPLASAIGATCLSRVAVTLLVGRIGIWATIGGIPFCGGLYLLLVYLLGGKLSPD